MAFVLRNLLCIQVLKWHGAILKRAPETGRIRALKYLGGAGHFSDGYLKIETFEPLKEVNAAVAGKSTVKLYSCLLQRHPRRRHGAWSDWRTGELGI